MSVEARLDGIPLLSDPEVSWDLKSGVSPSESVFGVSPEHAHTLLRGSGGSLRPVTLEMDDGNGRSVKIESLYVLAEEPRENPNVAKILVVDRRWFWSHAHVSRAFNTRRVVGSKRRRGPGGVPEIDPLTPEVAYHPATLKNGKPWKAKDALESVAQNCLNPEAKLNGSRANLTIDPAIGSRLDNLPLEDVELEDSGDNALARMLTYLPEARVKVRANGDVVIYSALDGADRSFAEDTGPEIIGYGSTSLLMNARLRPQKIHVLFAREHELRFDFTESASFTGGENDRRMSNVLPVPDFSLDLANGNTVDQGTWISLVSAFNAWKAPPRLGHLKSAQAWFKGLKRVMVPFVDLWTPIGLAGVRDPDADWMGRISAIQEHWRKTYRVSPRWMSRIAQLKPVLLATIDPATGTRAPALVWADYCRLATQRSLWKDLLDDDSFVYGMNFKSHPKSGNLKDGRPSPARVSVLDSDQGIIHFDFVPDTLRIYQTALPGMLTLEDSGNDNIGLPKDAGPTADIEDVSKPIAFNAISQNHKAPTLSDEYKVAVVLTASPATFNTSGNSHLFRVTKKPKDVKKFLPAVSQAGLEQAEGPELEIKVNASIETARVAWTDSDATLIERSFGIGTTNPQPIDHLVINKDGPAEGGASLDAIATAIAAQVYGALSDRYQGSRGVPLQSTAEPAGFVDSVRHQVTTQGAMLTSFQWPEKLAQIDMFSFLPDSTRRIVLRLAPSPMKVNA